MGRVLQAHLAPAGPRLPLRQLLIPRSSRTSLPEGPVGSRESPQPQGRKALRFTGIPADPRSTRKRHDRPVTPEVAGSSPVAPVDSLQIGISRCRFRRQIEADYTDFSLAAPKSNQSRPNRVRHPSISSRSRPSFTRATKAACDYTKRPEVTAPPRAIDAGRRPVVTLWLDAPPWAATRACKGPHDELAPLLLRRSSPSICCRAGASIAVAQKPCGTNLPVKGSSLCALRRGLDLLTCSCERLGRPQSGVGG